MRLLDVGCGWGSLSLHAAEHYGVHGPGVTLSREQHDVRRQARSPSGASADRVEVRLQDYREVSDGPFDAVGSIEMGEHVGEDNYPVYAGAAVPPAQARAAGCCCSRCRGARRPPRRRRVHRDLHRPRHAHAPARRDLGLLERAGFEVRDVQALREHYVRTVRGLARHLREPLGEAVALVGEEMARVWRLYLVGGALAFEEGRMGVDQILAVSRPPTGASGMPATREAYAG